MTPEKIDVVCTYYRRRHLWPVVEAGLLRNSECVNRVIIVNREQWDWQPMVGSIPVELLVVEPDFSEEFTCARATNAGMRQVTTPKFVIITDDVALPACTFERLLKVAEEYGFAQAYPVITPDLEKKSADCEEPRLMRPLYRGNPYLEGVALCCLVGDTAKFWHASGCDENFTHYGDMDYQLALSIILRHGRKAYALTDIGIWVAEATRKLNGAQIRALHPDEYQMLVVRDLVVEAFSRWGNAGLLYVTTEEGVDA